MNKIESQYFKGIAILFMIAYHLFNKEGNVALCDNLIFIGTTPLATIVSWWTHPVAFFLILGGYGLYKAYEKGDKNRWTRLIRLYLHYWVILALFLLIGNFLYPDKYPGSIRQLLYNFTGYWTTYNGEMWFLLPYVILSAIAPFLFRLIEKFKAVYVIAVSLFIYLCTSYCISRYGASFLYQNYWAYTPLLVFHLMFHFLLGAICARERFFEKIKGSAVNLLKYRILALGGVVVLLAINCFFKYNFFYALGMITCLLILPRPRWLEVILCKFGEHSMNMWMIHSWFCYYLFHDFVYSFRYPLLVFAVTVALSFMTSVLINMLVKPLMGIFFFNPARRAAEEQRMN